MTVKQMRYFVAVAEDLHFGRAAARLHVVQPAFSQQIRLLEESLGVNLLLRSSRHVALTDAGSAYLLEARKALQQFDLAAQAARDAAGGLTGLLSIGFVDNALWTSMPSMIREFRQRFPRIDLSLVQMSRAFQLSALHSQEIDVAILPGPVAGENLALQELAREPVYAVLPQGHRLCAGDVVDMGALAGEIFIAIPSVDDPRRINEIIYELCAQAGFAPTFGQPVQQMHTAISLVSAGLGVAIIPRWMRQAWSNNVAYRQVVPRSDYVLLIATRRNQERPAVREFLAIAGEIMGDRPEDAPLDDCDHEP